MRPIYALFTRHPSYARRVGFSQPGVQSPTPLGRPETQFSLTLSSELVHTRRERLGPQERPPHTPGGVLASRSADPPAGCTLGVPETPSSIWSRAARLRRAHTSCQGCDTGCDSGGTARGGVQELPRPRRWPASMCPPCMGWGSKFLPPAWLGPPGDQPHPVVIWGPQAHTH